MPAVRLRPVILTVCLAVLVAGALELAGRSGWLPFWKPNKESRATKSESYQQVKTDADSKSKADDADRKEEDDGFSFHARLKKFFEEGDEDALDGLKPHGVVLIHGRGGKGLNQQVMVDGRWYPVFDLSGAKNGEVLGPQDVRLAQVPLAITSPSPRPVKVGEGLVHIFEAVGGTPPYRWAIALSEGMEAFQMINPRMGMLGGESDKPLNARMIVTVTDAAAQQATAQQAIVVLPAEPLAITITELPLAVPGEPYHATLTGEGGVPPYVWSITSETPALLCDAATGELSGMITDPGTYGVDVTLEDSQGSNVTKHLEVQCRKELGITTESPLPPGSPSEVYSTTFEATGGVPPYVWTVMSGSLPNGLQLSPEGLLAGQTDKNEGLYHFDVQVTDSQGATYHRGYDLSVMQPLLVIASGAKAGIAWQPMMIARVLSSPLMWVAVTREGPEGTVEVYRGQGSNFVDHGLVAGVTYSYRLTAGTADAKPVAFGARSVRVLPMTLQRATPGANADPYADRVVDFNPLSPGGYGASLVPGNVTGPPDGRSAFAPASQPNELVSLHARNGGGGSITLEFTDNIIELGPGPDFTVFENVFFEGGDPAKRFMEPAVVEVALVQGQWYRFPYAVNPPAKGDANLSSPGYYAKGFAGVNATTGDNPTDPTRSGGDSFDIDELGIKDLSWVRYVRITSTGNKRLLDPLRHPVLHTDRNAALSGAGTSGFDLDAVSAVER